MWAYILALLPIDPNQFVDHCKIKISQISKETKNNKFESMVGILKNYHPFFQRNVTSLSNSGWTLLRCSNFAIQMALARLSSCVGTLISCS